MALQQEKYGAWERSIFYSTFGRGARVRLVHMYLEMNLKREEIMLREQIQTQDCAISLTWSYRAATTNVWWKKSEQWLPLGVKRGSCQRRGVRELFGVMEVIHIIMRCGLHSVWISQNTLNCILWYISLYLNYITIENIRRIKRRMNIESLMLPLWRGLRGRRAM